MLDFSLDRCSIFLQGKCYKSFDTEANFKVFMLLFLVRTSIIRQAGINLNITISLNETKGTNKFVRQLGLNGKNKQVCTTIKLK